MTDFLWNTMQNDRMMLCHNFTIFTVWYYTYFSWYIIHHHEVMKCLIFFGKVCFCNEDTLQGKPSQHPNFFVQRCALYKMIKNKFQPNWLKTLCAGYGNIGSFFVVHHGTYFRDNGGNNNDDAHPSFSIYKGKIYIYTRRAFTSFMIFLWKYST